MKKREKKYLNKKIAVGFLILILFGVIFVLGFRGNIFSQITNSITGKGIVNFAEIGGLTTEEIISDESLINDLRTTDSLVEKGGITKEYIYSEKEIKINDTNTSDVVNLKLVSDYVVYVPIGSDVKVAEFLLINSTSKELFEKIDFYNVRTDYQQIGKEFNLKYGTDYLEEVCRNEIDKETEKEIIVCLNETKTNWTLFKSLDELPKGEVKVGLFTSIKLGDKFEWIPTIKGFEIYEWALVENAWNSDALINASLPDIGDNSTPAVFYKDESWFLLSGNLVGTYNGYVWDGAQWMTNLSINETMLDAGANTRPAVFNIGSDWYVVSGLTTGLHPAYKWNGTAFAVNKTMNVSIADVGSSSAPAVFYMDESWYLISGALDGRFYGYVWNGSSFVKNMTINDTLPDIGALSTPTVFKKDGNYYMLAGESNGGTLGFAWNGTAFAPNSTINASLPDIGTCSHPYTFNMSSANWYTISGENAGAFYGFNWTALSYPQYNLASHNSTTHGQIVGFSINVSDDLALNPNGQYIFSSNNTGEWINYSQFKGLSNWNPDLTVNLSLDWPDNEMSPFVFYKDSFWHIIAGSYLGSFYGYDLNSNGSWIRNNTLVAGLNLGYMYSSPTVFYKDSNWYLISGSDGGLFYGYVWNGTDWLVNLTINASLTDIGFYSTPSVFYKDSSWYLISGGDAGGFNGFAWDGTQWLPNSTIIDGLYDLGTDSIPFVFKKNSNWYLISQDYGGTFDGFSLASNGTTWLVNSEIINNLPTLGGGSGGQLSPVFYKDSLWNMVASTAINQYYGFKYIEVFNFTTTPSFANSTLILNSTIGTIVGYRWYFTDNVGNTNSTPIYTLTSSDTTPPTYYSASHNSTEANQIIRFGVNATDETALEPNGMYIFSTNNTGQWVNESGVNFTAISEWANVTKTLNSTNGTIVGYRWYFNDSAGNTNSTPIYTLTSSDTTLPTYYSASHNSTTINSLVRFGVNVSDNLALHPNGMYIFSTNNSGQWINESGVNFTATPSWANVTKTLNSTNGTIVGYRWYFNDSAGNTNSTPIYTLTTIIECGLSLPTDNSVYTLGSNLASSGGCFDITGNNITLNCNNYNISGTGIASGINITGANATIKNCGIYGFNIGLLFNNTYGGLVNNSNIEMSSANSYGVIIRNTNSTLINNTNSKSVNSAVFIDARNSNTLSNNITNGIFNSTSTGMGCGAIAASSSFFGQNNGFSNLKCYSVGYAALAASYQKNLLADNVTTYTTATSDSWKGGLYLVYVNDSIIKYSNLSGYSGAVIVGGLRNLFANNTLKGIQSSNSRAIYFYGGYNNSDNLFYNNTLKVTTNTNDLVLIESGGGSTNNTFYWNNFTNVVGKYVNDLAGGNYFNATINGNPEGNIWYNVFNHTLSIAGSTSSLYGSGYYIGNSGTGYPYNSTTSLNKVTGNVFDYGPLTDYTDTAPPTYYSASHNSTTPGQIVQFSINVSDNIALQTNGWYIFSTNNSGTWINDSNHWEPNSTINASLPYIGSPYSSSSVFYKDSSWYLIAGEYDGVFTGFAWNGTDWLPNSTINASLPDIGYNSKADVFYKDSSWYLISGTLSGEFYGFAWDGTQWLPNSTINASLPDIGDYSTPSVFYKDSSWYLLSGNITGEFYGFAWDGTQWLPNSTINASLPTFYENFPAPSVFYRDGTWYLIIGDNSGIFYGYNWSGTAWTTDLAINASLPDIGSRSSPEVFYKDETWYMVAGNITGLFNGFKFKEASPFTTTPSWANVTKILNSTNGTIVGYRWYFSDSAGNTNSTSIYTLTSSDTTPPTYYSASHNSTGAGTLVRFGINVTDNIALQTNGWYIFSTNNTGIWINDSNHWEPNSTINNSLSTFSNSNLAPTVFYKDSSWYLINGHSGGTFSGFAWSGTQWVYNSTITAGLPNTYDAYQAPNVFYKNDSWYMLVGELNGIFYGFAWNGTQWLPNSTINSSLGDVGGWSAPSAFYKDSSWYLISGGDAGGFFGFVWTGSAWAPNSTINTSLPDIGSDSRPSVFQKDGTWYMISGDANGYFYGFAWNGTNWLSNSEINASLPDVNSYSSPSIFQKDETWYMISGEWTTFPSFNFLSPNKFTTTPSWANVTKTLNSTAGTIVGYRWYFSDNVGNTNSTPIYIISCSNTCTYSSGNWNVDCNDNCTITTNYNLSGNNLSFINAGTFTLNANVTAYNRVSISNRCKIIINNGQRLGG